VISAALDGRFHIADGTAVGQRQRRSSAGPLRQDAGQLFGPAGRRLVGRPDPELDGLRPRSTTVTRITEDVTAFGNISYQGQSGGVQDTVTAATPAIYLKDVDLMSCGPGWSIKRIQVAVFVQNLFEQANRAAAVHQQQRAAGQSLQLASRTIGANVIYRW
jgi:hypothetical protein